jgi:hypothetical protein
MFIDLCLHQWIMNRSVSGNVGLVRNSLFMRLQRHPLSALTVMRSIQSCFATILKSLSGGQQIQKKWMMR